MCVEQVALVADEVVEVSVLFARAEVARLDTGGVAAHVEIPRHKVRLAERAIPLVEHHLAPVQLFEAGASDRSVRRLSTKVGRLDLLARVCEADQGGRPPLEPTRAKEACAWLLEAAERLDVTTAPPVRLARGEHLIELGLRPGPGFSGLLQQAYDAQLDGDVVDEVGAKAFLARLVAEG